MIELQSHPALVIVDMQNGFCHKEGSFGKIGLDVSLMGSVAPQINQLRAVCHERNIPVIFARVGFNADYSDSGLQFAMFPRTELKKLGAFIRDTWDFEIVDELKPAANEIVINKTRNSAFWGTKLDQLLRDRGINHVILAGVGSNVCVESTARDSFSYDFYTTTVSDATATLTDEAHRASMETLEQFGGTATLADIEEAIKRLPSQ